MCATRGRTPHFETDPPSVYFKLLQHSYIVNGVSGETPGTPDRHVWWSDEDELFSHGRGTEWEEEEEDQRTDWDEFGRPSSMAKAGRPVWPSTLWQLGAEGEAHLG